jgi:hypothetical protein
MGRRLLPHPGRPGKAAGLELDYALLGAVQPTLSHPERNALGWPAFTEMIAGCRCRSSPWAAWVPATWLRQGGRRPRRGGHPGLLAKLKGAAPQNKSGPRAAFDGQ